MQEKKFSLHFDPVGDVLAAAKSCEEAVFLQAYGNTADQWQDEYGPYEHASIFLAITEPSGDAVGCARLILPSAAGFKSLVDIEGDPWFVDANDSAALAGLTAGQTCDIATLAVRRGVTGAGVLSAALYHGVFRVTRANSIRWLVMIMDARARRLLSMLDLETHVLPGTMAAPYLGSAASIPIFADAVRMMELQRERNPDGYGLVSDGIGLDTIAFPAPEAYVVPARFKAQVIDFVPRSESDADQPGPRSIGTEPAPFWRPLSA